jgi:Zn-dependent peptidase ImmA (M78 family)
MKKQFSRIPRERELIIGDFGNAIGEDYFKQGGTHLDSILEAQGINLYYDSFKESFDGLLVNSENSWSVYCNSRTGNIPGSVRGRFTVAHELGHYFIDEHRKAIMAGLIPSMGESAQKDSLMEREADLFASRLLLPGAFFEKSLRGVRPGMKGILDLANEFDVSVKCAALRYLNEDPASCALSFWSWDKQLVWKWFSTSLWNSGIRSLKTDLIQKGATEICLNSGSDGAGNLHESAAPMEYLFRTGDGAPYGEIFHEEALVLGEYGVLVLLRASSGKLKPLAEVLQKRYCRN